MGWKMVTRTLDFMGVRQVRVGLREEVNILLCSSVFVLAWLVVVACLSLLSFLSFLHLLGFIQHFQHLSTVLFSKDPSQGGWQLRTGLTNMSPSRVRKRYFALPVTSSVVSLYQMHQMFWWSFRRFFESPTGTSREWLGTRLTFYNWIAGDYSQRPWKDVCMTIFLGL